jgi:hypothetical protein
MSEKTDRWLTIHVPLALSLIAIIASGSVAYGATQTTASSNRDRIEALEDTITARFDQQASRIDRVLELLVADRKDATSQEVAHK